MMKNPTLLLRDKESPGFRTITPETIYRNRDGNVIFKLILDIYKWLNVKYNVQYMMTMISVLYVDDDPDFLEIAKRFLERTGEFSVRTCTSTTEALSLLQESTFDTVISDYQMPEMNGISFLKKTRKIDSLIPFILFTGRGKEEVVIEALNNGADHYLQKGGDPATRFAELADQIRQIIDHRRAEHDNLQKTEEMERFFSLVRDLFCIVDMDGAFIRVNRAWETTLGLQIDDLKGETFLDHVHPEDCNETRSSMAELAKGNPIRSMINRFRCRDGIYRWIEWNTVPYQGRAIFVTGRDITELERIEYDLCQKNQQLNLLISVTQHDIRNKILVMEGYLDLARNETPDEESTATLIENLKMVAGEIQSQIEFIDSYLNCGVNEPTRVQLADLLPSLSIPSTILFQADLDGIEMFPDPMLEKVFYNLLDNTIRHGKKVTRVRVSAVESADYLVIVWEDDGVGIPQKEKELIFRRGYGENTGLGMFLIREILALINCTITETGTPGRGARFEIVVPRGMYRRAGQDRIEGLSGLNQDSWISSTESVEKSHARSPSSMGCPELPMRWDRWPGNSPRARSTPPGDHASGDPVGFS